MSAAVEPAEGQRFDAHLPLLIVGGGAGGLVAALAAQEAGAEVAVIERDPLPRGSTAMSSGLIPAAGTRFQAACGVTDDAPALMAEDIQRKNGGAADPAVVASLAERSAATVEWLADAHGVPFSLVEGFSYPGHSRLRMHGTPRRSGEELMDCLLRAAEGAGVPILTDATVRTLYADADGRVRGLALERPTGARETLGCDALLLACNGYGGAPDLVARHLPGLKDAVYYGHVGNQGDAVRWGEALGVGLADLGGCQGHGSLAVPHQILISWASMMQGGVQINAEGRRFSNETEGYSEQAARVLAQPGGAVWSVFDARVEAGLTQFQDFRDALEAGAVRVFADADALADGIGAPAKAVRETLLEIDALAGAGGTDRFGRRFPEAARLTPPYRAVKVTGALFHTQGGIAIDACGRALDPTGAPLTNLFAVGGAARGVSGPDDRGYLSGNGLLSAVVMGALAGRAAARLLAAEAA